MVRFTLRIPKQLDDLIDRKAKTLGISKNSVIVTLLWSQIGDSRTTDQNEGAATKEER